MDWKVVDRFVCQICRTNVAVVLSAPTNHTGSFVHCAPRIAYPSVHACRSSTERLGFYLKLNESILYYLNELSHSYCYCTYFFFFYVLRNGKNVTCTKPLDMSLSNFVMQILSALGCCIIDLSTTETSIWNWWAKRCQENCLSVFVNVSRILHHVVCLWRSFACSCSQFSED